MPMTVERQDAFIDDVAIVGPAAERVLELAQIHGCGPCGVLPVARDHLCEHGVTPAPHAPRRAVIDVLCVDPDYLERLAHVWLR